MTAVLNWSHVHRRGLKPVDCQNSLWCSGALEMAAASLACLGRWPRMRSRRCCQKVCMEAGSPGVTPEGGRWSMADWSSWRSSRAALSTRCCSAAASLSALVMRRGFSVKRMGEGTVAPSSRGGTCSSLIMRGSVRMPMISWGLQPGGSGPGCRSVGIALRAGSSGWAVLTWSTEPAPRGSRPEMLHDSWLRAILWRVSTVEPKMRARSRGVIRWVPVVVTS